MRASTMKQDLLAMQSFQMKKKTFFLNEQMTYIQELQKF